MLSHVLVGTVHLTGVLPEKYIYLEIRKEIMYNPTSNFLLICAKSMKLYL